MGQSAIRFPLLLAGITVLAISSNEYQIYYEIHTTVGEQLIEISRGVLNGHPPWRAFQARLLGPFAFECFELLMQRAQAIFPSMYAAFERIFSQPDTRDLAILNAFVAGMILANNFICFLLLFRYSGSVVKATGGTVVGGLLFVMLSHYWLYMWDLFELVFFCFLAYVMFGRKKPGATFFIIYALSLANRESAAFFGVWLICYASAHRIYDNRTRWYEVGLGIALVLIAVAYVLALRQSLLVESTLGHETGPIWGSVPAATPAVTTVHQAFGNHLLILENGVTFLKNLVSTHFYVDALLIALMLHGGILARAGLVRRDAQLVAIGAFNLILLVSILNFALLNETRLFLICIPFVVFSIVTFSSEIFAFIAQVDRQTTKYDKRRILAFEENRGA